MMRLHGQHAGDVQWATGKTAANISLSVNLGDYNPERAADLVKHGVQILGKRLMAVTIGNEPNGFAPNMVSAHALRPNGYTADDFGKEAMAYADAMY